VDFDLDDHQTTRLAEAAALVGDVPAAYPTTAVDRDAYARLADAGFVGRPLLGRGDHLMAALVVEELSHLAVVLPVAAGALVAPGLGIPGRSLFAVADAGALGLVRYAGQADAAIVIGTDGVDVAQLGPETTTDAETAYVYPIGAIEPDVHERVADADPCTARRLWRLGLAAELAGALGGAVEQVAAYLNEREQFGKPLGSLQALQHRVAEAFAAAEAARWFVRYAAWHHDDEEAVAAAALTASDRAHELCMDLHQLCGARGFTLDFGLYRWTLRLEALRQELGGPDAHARLVTAARWRGAAG
jgi:alkylation response protein AidB-like acyl-CoA dehydrogenase